eukprot:6474035-Alexandrium_andersonii.AAC.1
MRKPCGPSHSAWGLGKFTRSGSSMRLVCLGCSTSTSACAYQHAFTRARVFALAFRHTMSRDA